MAAAFDSGDVGRKLCEVDAVRKARLEAQDCKFKLEQSRNELLQKNAELQQLQQHVQYLQQQAPAAQADDLEVAKLEAEGYKYKLAVTELELVKQLDSLRELQWQLDSVVVQLGLQLQVPHPLPAGQSHGTVDGLALFGKIEELSMAQQHAEENRQKLAAAQGELHKLRQTCATQQRQLGAASSVAQPAAEALPVTYTFEGVRHVRQGNAGPGAPDSLHNTRPNHAALLAGQCPAPPPVSSTGRQLIDALLQENEELRSRLVNAEDRGQKLERDLEAELLIKTEQHFAAPLPKTAGGHFAAPQMDVLSSQKLQAATATSLNGHRRAASRDGSPARMQRPAVSESMEVLARKRLEFRLEEKDRQMCKLRGVIKELEAKLVEAYKRQADLVMKESSWREQESLDRRLAELEDERAQMAAKVEAAQAEAEAARREAAVQRRLARQLQQRPAAEDSESTRQMVELLQKRVKILEAQNIRLRLAKRPSTEPSSRRVTGELSRADSEDAAAEEPGHGAATAENQSPNSAVEVGSAVGPSQAGSRTRSMLEGNPVLEKWEADKRLQKKVELLQSKLKEKAAQLATSHAARERLAQQVQHLQADLAQGAGKKQQGAPGPAPAAADHPASMLPEAKVRELQQQLAQLDEVQRERDTLERRLAALEQRLPQQQPSASSDDCWAISDPAMPLAVSGAQAVGAGSAGTVPAAASATAAAGGGGSRPYRASDYGNAKAAQEGLETKLLEKDIKLFDLTLERDQALAQVARLQQRVDCLFEQLAPAPGSAAHGGSSGAAGPKASTVGAVAAGQGNAAGAGGRGGGRRHPTPREQELLDTIALLKSALERTRKGLESGVSNSKYMQAVDKGKQLKAQVASLESQLGDAAKTREEVVRLQQQLGQLHGVNSALKAQLKAARQQGNEAASAREEIMNAQVAQLERSLQERDVQLAQAKVSTEQYDEEIRVLMEEGLHPAALVQELLTLRPRLRELEEHNASLQKELATFDAQFFQELEQLKAEHEMLHAHAAKQGSAGPGEAEPLGSG